MTVRGCSWRVNPSFLYSRRAGSLVFWVLTHAILAPRRRIHQRASLTSSVAIPCWRTAGWTASLCRYPDPPE